MITKDVALGEGVIIAQPDLVNLYGCSIGAGTKVGAFVEIRRTVRIGAHCKIQAFAFIPEGVEIGDGVLIGPHVCFTNDLFPRAVDADGRPLRSEDWEIVPTRVGDGAAIGANATILCGLHIGAFSLVGAGAVVTANVPPHAIVVGNPARIIGDTRHRGSNLPDFLQSAQGFGKAPETRLGRRAAAVTEEPLIILGLGGNSLGALDAALEARRAGLASWQVMGFLDDRPQPDGAKFHGFPILGRLDDAWRFTDASFVNGIGGVQSFRNRPDFIARTGLPPERFATVVHPRATVSPLARVGIGCILLANSVVCAEAVVGDHVVVLENSVVNHNVTAGDHTLIAASVSISGFVAIEPETYIGCGSTIRQQVRIGRGALVGMGSVVLNDVPPGQVVVGNPARLLREHPVTGRVTTSG